MSTSTMKVTDGRGNGADPEDRLLVGSFLRRREEKVFRALYRRHSPALYRLALRFMRGNSRDAEEVMQVTWIRAVENLAGFRWESTLRSWLTGIALNCSREFLRRQKRVTISEPAELQDLAGSPMVPQDVSRIDLERAIDHLPDGYREVLILHDIEGYTHQEIGEFLGIESGTSKSQLFRARRAVRAKLTETGMRQHE